MVDTHKHLYGSAISTFMLCLLIGMGSLSLWLPHWLVSTLIVATGIGLSALSRRYLAWVGWAFLMSCGLGIGLSYNADDKKLSLAETTNPAVPISQLADRPNGDIVHIQNARRAYEFTTTHRVGTKRTRFSYTPNTIYYRVAPLVEPNWKAASDPVVAWIKLSEVYSGKIRHMELVTVTEGYDTAIKNACTKHQLNCSNKAKLLRPLNTSFAFESIPSVLVVISLVWGACCAAAYGIARLKS